MERAKTVILATKDGILFVKLKDLPILPDFILVSLIPIKDPNAYCVEVKGEAISLHFPELSIATVHEHLGTFLCGIFNKSSLVEIGGIIYSSSVRCPFCRNPLFPYNGLFICDSCNIVVAFNDGVGIRTKWPEEVMTKNRFILVTEDSVLSSKLSDTPYKYHILPKIVSEIKEQLGVNKY